MKIEKLIIAMGGMIILPPAPLTAQNLAVTTITAIDLVKTNGEYSLQLTSDNEGLLTPLSRVEGERLIIEIPQVRLGEGVNRQFIPDDIDSNLASVSIIAIENETIKIEIWGKQGAPQTEIKTIPQGIVFNINENNILAEEEIQNIEIIVTGENETESLREIIPQAQLQREEILTRPSLFLGDIIKQLPGVVMTGNPGEDKYVRLRGLGKEFTRLQIDGVTLPDTGEKREYQIGSFPSLFVDQINIIRNSSAEFESDGIAGRVAVETVPIPNLGESTFQGKIGYGGRNSLANGLFDSALVYGERKSENFGFIGGLGYSRNPLDINKIKTFSDGEVETEDEFKDQTYHNALLKLGYFYPQGSITFQPYFFSLQELKEITIINTTPPKNGGDAPKINTEIEREDKNKDNWGIAFNNNHRFNNGMTLDSQLGYFTTIETKDENKEKLKDNQVDKTELELESKEDSIINFTSALTIPINGGVRQELKIGTAVRLRDRFRDKSRLEIDKNGNEKDKTEAEDKYNLTENYFAGFIQNQIFFNDTFSILPGVRVEHVNLNAESGSNDNNPSKKSITDILPSIFFLYEPRADLAFNLGLSRSLNRPEFDELGPFISDKDDRFVIGNPELDPARAWNLDIGATYKKEYFNLGINFFNKWITGVLEEEITDQIIDGKDVFKVQNVGDGTLTGVELEQEINFGFTGVKALEGLTLWANQTIIGSELNDRNGVSRSFQEVPNFISNLGFNYNYEPSGTQVALYWNYVGDSSTLEADGTITNIRAKSAINLSLRQKISDQFSLFFDIYNLTNETSKIEEEIEPNGESSIGEEKGGQSILFGVNWRF
ncbi:MAG: TonB-dependent receptor [Cyanobacterium sp. T60_A2020_053]|nr:TonB-dependent receptor [Cyanobacterium sp. T60_A2020_053]